MSALELKKSHVTEVKCLANPPAAVKHVLCGVVALLGHDADDWKNSEKVMTDPNFFNRMQNLDPKTVKPEHAHYAREKLSVYNVEKIKQKSFTASFMYSLAVRMVALVDQGQEGDI